MTLNVFAKLFLGLFLSILLVLGAVMASVQWSFRQGFAGYLQKVEEQRLDLLVGKLASRYGRQGSWEWLRDNPGAWFELLRDVRKSGEAWASPHGGDGEPPSEEIFPGPPRPPEESSFPPFAQRSPEHRPPPPAFREPGRPHRGPPVPEERLRVLDAGRKPVVGFPPPPEEMGKEAWRPITAAGATVGWLAYRPLEFATDRPELAFIRQQTHSNYSILGFALWVSVLVSLFLARQFLLPIRRIAAGARALAAGNYDTEIPASGKDELGQLAVDFNRLARTLKQNEAARRQWVADISHELRTPLSILRGEIEALQDGIREANPERLRSLHTEVVGLGKLVDDLYELSLSDLGALSYRMEPVDVGELLEAAVDSIQPRFDSKGIVLRNRVDARTAPAVSGDPHRLRQLFLNLLDNSCTYTDPGGFCELSLRRERGSVIIDFQDSAPGVPAADLDRLFERLYRCDASRCRNLGGSGLGLSICKNIAEAHSGTLTAYPSPQGRTRNPGGTAFAACLMIPRRL